MNKTPNFIIFGAPKCGTTALSEYLRSNPSVYMSYPKELHYFCDDLKIPGQVRTHEQYLRSFTEATDRQVAIGEASPLYLLSETAAKNAHKQVPDAKIIVMLRSTPEYLYSYYSHLLYLGDENLTRFDQAWQAQAARKSGKLNYPVGCREAKRLDYAWVGRLGQHVERLLEYFPRDQVLFVFLEDMKQDPRKTYADVLQFIGAEDDGRSNFEVVNQNKRHKFRWLATLPHRLPKSLIASVRRLKKILGLNRYSLTGSLMNMNTETRVGQSLSAPMRSVLVDEFRDDIRLLAQLTGKSLDHWL